MLHRLGTFLASVLPAYLLFLYAPSLHATQLPRTLSADTKISALTIGPSQKNVYAAFGHSALRIQDTSQHLDVLFNYGVFDFDPPAFYFTFLKGELWYKLEVFDTKGFLAHTRKANRSIKEQTLALSQEEKQHLFELLVENYQPENQYYFYNYIYNNCATKIRDVLEEALPDQLRLASPLPHTPQSFRSLMNAYMKDFLWFRFGINLALGAAIDLKADERTYMFLPDYVASAIEKATLRRSNQHTPLSTHSQWLFQATPHQHTASFPSPAQLGWAFLIFSLLMTYLHLRKKAHHFALETSVLLLYGLLGTCLLWLWTSTEHLSQQNYNLLWASPLHIPAVILWYIPKARPWVIRYFMLCVAILLLVLLGWNAWPQAFPQDILPFLLALLTRLLYHIYGYWKAFT